MKKYDYLIVGAGLYGATFAYEAAKKGKKCLVIDRRNHIGGNIYCEKINDITKIQYLSSNCTNHANIGNTINMADKYHNENIRGGFIGSDIRKISKIK